MPMTTRSILRSSRVCSSRFGENTGVPPHLEHVAGEGLPGVEALRRGERQEGADQGEVVAPGVLAPGRRAVLSSLHARRVAHASGAKPACHDLRGLRVHVGPGYRLYFTRRGGVLIIMLAGVDKGFQARDIKRAQRIATELGEAP